MSRARVIVGIDLGTTNTAVAWAALGEDGSAGRVQVLEVPQLVAPGELARRSQLPSFVYLAGEHDLPPSATAVPWDRTRRHVVGELARSQGARVPGRMIASAKSWLCHPDVDRQAAILPWGSTEAEKLSPVESSARVLGHVADAWRHLGHPPLGGDGVDVVVTVPASFDEAARELTAEAARRAGIAQVTLLEEPQAVFYAWIDRHGAAARKQALAPGDAVLVCDVGGGTTDFTLIRVGDDGDSFARTAVGDHLLLGGDNIDIALARSAEARLGKLDAIQWHGLVHACRLAKEQLLADDTLESRPITVQARGSKLIGGTLRTEVTRTEVTELVLEGFLPLVEREARPARGKAGLMEFGLPFAADAAITRHLAAFLARHGVERVDAVLFNGGAMKPPSVRARVLEQLGRWQAAPPPRELEGGEPELAVARGAAYYGLVRHGAGSRIAGGAARAFYVGVAGGDAICVLPRGAEEGAETELAEELAILCNRPASFRLYTSSGRSDQPGDAVRPGDPALSEEIVELPPLVTVLRSPGRAEARVRVRARLTEVGTLELWCVEAADAEKKWRLSFDLRGDAATRGAAAGAEAEVDADAAASAPPAAETEAGKALITAAFNGAAGAPPVAQLMKELEKVMAARRDEWSTSTCRALWDALHGCEATRTRTADHEARYLNLVGFLLRPGWGAPLDQWRVQEMWRLWNAGLRHEKDEACRLGWWIVWRRIAAGLKRTQQEQIYDRLAPLFLPGKDQKARWFKVKPSPQEVAEMWRALGSLERLNASAKTRLGDALAERIAAGKDVDVGLWALGRMGARALLYGPIDAVVAPAVAARWLDVIMAGSWPTPERAVFALAQIARKTGDRARDIDDELRARVIAHLRATPAGERPAHLVEQVIALEAREERVAFGDSLPSGLRRLSEGGDRI